VLDVFTKYMHRWIGRGNTGTYVEYKRFEWWS